MFTLDKYTKKKMLAFFECAVVRYRRTMHGVKEMEELLTAAQK